MDHNELEELHYITPIANLASIGDLGLLSHELAKKVQHQSVAMAEIQDRRERIIIPGGRPLHEYVNLYLNARNKMMWKVVRSGDHSALCVVRVDTEVLLGEGVVVADGNASSTYTRFSQSPKGLSRIDKSMVFAKSWTHADQIEEWKHGRIVCAEVLVPEIVPPKTILGVYVSCDAAARRVAALALDLECEINASLFFE